jgi:hypothetical protein
MIQMIGRGLRPIDSTIYPNVEKIDCLVLDFGISSMLHGNLEQEVGLNVDDLELKQCPACGKEIPQGLEKCPLCSVDMGEELERQGVKRKKLILEQFVMSEINLLVKSHFPWVDLKLPNCAKMTSGANSWCCVLKHSDKWIAVAGSKRNSAIHLETAMIYRGNELQAIASGNDFLCKYETQESAIQFGDWRLEKATKTQLKYLPPQFQGINQITKGEASTILTYSTQFYTEINDVLSGHKQ